MVKNTSLCGLGQTAPNPVLSTLRFFRHEYEELLQPDPPFRQLIRARRDLTRSNFPIPCLSRHSRLMTSRSAWRTTPRSSMPPARPGSRSRRSAILTACTISGPAGSAWWKWRGSRSFCRPARRRSARTGWCTPTASGCSNYRKMTIELSVRRTQPRLRRSVSPTATANCRRWPTRSGWITSATTTVIRSGGWT